MNTPATPTPNLTELLASMDAVDRARTKDDLITEALDLPARKAALAAKIKATYAEQGVPVSDAAIAEGVDAHYAGRHSFQPLPKGFNWVMAHAWVNRKMVAVGVAILIGAAIVMSMITNGVERIRQAQAAKAVAAKQAQIEKETSDRAAEAERQRRRALQEQAAQAAKAAALKAMPDRLTSIQRAIEGVAKEQAVKQKASSIAATGIGLAQAGDLTGAERSFTDLNAILTQLNLEYDLRINLSGPKPYGQTVDGRKWTVGGWRTFGGTRTHYIIVNAVDKDNQPVKVAVRNAETGVVETVPSWCEQISEVTFNEMVAEKRRTGTFANTLFGRKQKGYMEASYRVGVKASSSEVPLPNAADHRITRW